MQIVPPVTADLGGFTVRRLLPRSMRRMVGPWCFLDLMGPVDLPAHAMDVPPHPHIGLQTVTWLMEGELLHKDSLDSEALARPGALNLMTSGRGIAHSEESPARARGRLHGVQLWVALPDAVRDVEPAFDHYAERPIVPIGDALATVFMGRLAGVDAAARAFSPLVGAELALPAGARVEVPLDPAFEHALVPLTGVVEDVPHEHLAFVEAGAASVVVQARAASRVLLIGGAPFGERILMWWNFVARTSDEIQAARDDWEGHRRFGDVTRYAGARLPAPPFVARPVPPNPMS